MRKDLEVNKSKRIGKINISNEGYEMKIIKYDNCDNIWIEFQDEYKARVYTSYKAFKKGEVKNPFHKTICDVGYVGIGKYKTRENRKNTKAYTTWTNMIKRCYDPYEINRHLTYIDSYVCDEWLCFQNFAKWFYKNYYEIPNERMCVDKDILIKGNKIYSPETCLIVPNRINVLFIKCDKSRGKYPIGVCFYKNKFMCQCRIYENNKQKQKYLGLYNTLEEAFCAYKKFKESYIKQVADEYKDLIPQRLYDAMYKYEVEIND